MARIRTIKPEFFTSEQIVECSASARLLFVGLWCFSDDGGVHPASVKRIKMEVFPGDDISAEQVQGLIDELIRAKLIAEFEAGGESYWCVLGWKNHQKIDRPTLKHPQLDDDEISRIRRSLDDESTSPRRILDEQSTRPRDGMEWNGRESNGREKTPHTSANADGGEAEATAIVSTKPKSLIPDDDGDDDPPKAIKPAKPDSINPGDLVVAWNRCVGLAPITSMTVNRKKSLRARSRDPIFRDNWQAAIQRVGTTVFCCGGGPRGWRADVDWFLRPDTIVQIMEGKYDDRDANGNNGGGVSVHRGISSEEARLQRSLQACEDFARNG